MKSANKKTSVYLIAITITCILLFIVLVSYLVWLTVLENKAEHTRELVEAIRLGDNDTVEYIVEKYPYSVNLKTSQSWYWLRKLIGAGTVWYPIQMACSNGDYCIIKLLLESGADCNAAFKGEEESKSPLIRIACAAERDEEEKREKMMSIELLLKYGADKSYKDQNGKTAYDYALERGHTEAAELLKP